MVEPPGITRQQQSRPRKQQKQQIRRHPRKNAQLCKQFSLFFRGPYTAIAVFHQQWHQATHTQHIGEKFTRLALLASHHTRNQVALAFYVFVFVAHDRALAPKDQKLSRSARQLCQAKNPRLAHCQTRSVFSNNSAVVPNATTPGWRLRQLPTPFIRANQQSALCKGCCIGPNSRTSAARCTAIRSCNWPRRS